MMKKSVFFVRTMSDAVDVVKTFATADHIEVGMKFAWESTQPGNTYKAAATEADLRMSEMRANPFVVVVYQECPDDEVEDETENTDGEETECEDDEPSLFGEPEKDNPDEYGFEETEE